MINRPLRYAGSWYEADPTLLEQQLDSFLESVPKTEAVLDDIGALIVPHAGYAYSGAAAAAAYKAVMNKKVNRIFLLGPSHHVGFIGVAVPTASFFETPFGNLSVDQHLVKVLKQQPHFLENEEAHLMEHSLEMQLPFIKKIFPATEIVPLLVGRLQGAKEIHEVASLIKSCLQEDDLIIVSSDFTHYGPRFRFMPCPERMNEKIRELDTRAYEYLQQLDTSGLLHFYQETGVTICGVHPMAILLALLPQIQRSRSLPIIPLKMSSRMIHDIP